MRAFWGKTLRYNDRHTFTARIQFSKEVETFSDNTEDCHLTYVWNNWEIDRIIEQIEDYFGKKPLIQR